GGCARAGAADPSARSRAMDARREVFIIFDSPCVLLRAIVADRRRPGYLPMQKVSIGNFVNIHGALRNWNPYGVPRESQTRICACGLTALSDLGHCPLCPCGIFRNLDESSKCPLRFSVSSNALN